MFILCLVTNLCGNATELSEETQLESQRPDVESGRGKPDIILLVADDHGTDALGAYGNRIIQTPALDALARDGLLFTNAFATTASCSASRSVLLSGRYNHANGQYGHAHNYHHFSAFDDLKSLPVLLSQAGYLTAHIGKLHVAPRTVFDFDVWLETHKLAGDDNYREDRSVVEMAQAALDFIEQSDRPFFLYFATSDPHRSGGPSSGSVPVGD